MGIGPPDMDPALNLIQGSRVSGAADLVRRIIFDLDSIGPQAFGADIVQKIIGVAARAARLIATGEFVR